MIIMSKNKVLFLLLAHLCVLSVWGQGFGKRILTNEDWYFNPGDGKYWGLNITTILNGGNWICRTIGV